MCNWVGKSNPKTLQLENPQQSDCVRNGIYTSLIMTLMHYLYWQHIDTILSQDTFNYNPSLDSKGLDIKSHRKANSVVPHSNQGDEV